MTRRAAFAATLSIAALALASCGGGVDSGGTGAPVASFASGPITGFGSVIVNGVHFDDATAAVTDGDGNPRSRDDLRLGMTTDVNGSVLVKDADGHDASTARSIVFSSEIVGPVGASDLAARTLTVFGQTIDIATTTVFDSGLAGGQGALAAGDVIAVYAHFDPATGRYAATRIERQAAGAAFALRGIVSVLDATARTFSIGPTRISYAGVAADAVPAALANGRFVRVRIGAVPSVAGVWIATRIGDGSPRIADDEEATIKGLVSAFVSSSQFSVNGTPVDARAASFPNGTAGLRLGARVEVEGRSSAGTVLASEVKVVSEGDDSGRDFDVRGAIVSIDRAAQTFVVRSVVVSYAGTVEFHDGNAAALAVGLQVEARGTLSADGTRLQATRIDFRH